MPSTTLISFLKTSIDATQIIIPAESPEEFEAFAAALRDTWNPADLAERAFVDRLRIAEAQIWDRAILNTSPANTYARSVFTALLGRRVGAFACPSRSLRATP
jgi:hypothetical protein